MTRFRIILGLPLTLILIGTLSYFRNVLVLLSNREIEHSIQIKTSSAAVEDILSSMNTSVDPCDNFYNYACQGWNQKNSRPDYMPFWSEFTKLGKEVTELVIDILEKPTSVDDDFPALVQAKQFYQKCTQVSDDEADLQSMLNVLDNYGGWPILYDQGDWDESQFNWINSTTGLKRSFSETVILNAMAYQYPNWMNKTNTIVITPPTKSSGDLYGNIDESTDETLPTRLKYLIVNISKTFLEFQGKTNINETYLEEKAMEIMQVTAELSYINGNEEDILPTLIKCLGLVQKGNCDKYDMSFMQFHLDNFTSPTPNKLNINIFLQSLYQTKDSLYFQQAIVIQPDYLFSLGRYLTLLKTNEEIANFLHFRMILKMIPLSGNTHLKSLLRDFATSFLGVKGKPDRKMFCAMDTQQKFFQAVGQQYVKIRGNTDTEFEMIDSMYHNLKESIDNLIEDSSESYLNKSFLKLENKVTRLCLGYPAWMKGDISSEMQSEYSLVLNQSSSFLQQSMEFNSWKLIGSLESIERNLSESLQENECLWTIFPGNIGAYNLFTHYSVYLPLGIIQPPFFSPELPMAINYGKLGSILGHEIVHSLVVPELLELKNGSLTPIAQCLVDQYDEFTVFEMQANVSLGGKRTVQENIPDNLGLLAAYKAFKKAISLSEMDKTYEGLVEFSNDQLFFLGFAQNWCGISTTKFERNSMQNDNHPPGIFRALGTLRNSKEFAEAWKCPTGSNMNPNAEVYQKCTVF